MKILLRYFLREFLKFFFIILLGLTAILLVAEFFDKVDEFYAKKPPTYLVVEYLLLQCPRFLLFASPASSLLSILLIIGIAGKWREIVAIQASGGNIKRLFSYFLVVGVIISLLALILGETLVPIATREAVRIRNVKILQKPLRITHREGALWIKGLDGSLIRIKDFVAEDDTALKVSIFSFIPSFELIKRIEAESAKWIDGRWELKDATVFDFNHKTVAGHKSIASDAIEEPKIFKDEMRKPEEMNFFELYAYHKRLERAGFKNPRYIMELYGKLAYPMVNFVMVLFGVALALQSRLGGGMRAVGLGLLVSLFYWLIYSVSISMGNTGNLPPWFAPWVGPLLFGIAGGYLYFRIKG